MLDNEIVTNAHKLKLRIQKEIMDRQQEIASTTDIGYTSWDIAEKIVSTYQQEKPKGSRKIVDFLKAKL